MRDLIESLYGHLDEARGSSPSPLFRAHHHKKIRPRKLFRGKLNKVPKYSLRSSKKALRTQSARLKRAKRMAWLASA